MNINLSLLGEALRLYQHAGFRHVEVPWSVPRSICEITVKIDKGSRWTLPCDRTLIGSAEQGFLYLVLESQSAIELGGLDAFPAILRNVDYVACSPCFRDDPLDGTHQPSFMKLELFRLISTTGGGPNRERIHTSWQFTQAALRVMKSLSQQSGKELSARIEPTVTVPVNPGVRELDTYDIISRVDGKDVELGSYGIRTLGDFVWMYGTGLALPRFSFAL